MRIVAGTAGTPAEPSCLKVRNQKLLILKSISYCYLLCEAATLYVRQPHSAMQPHYVSQPIYVRNPHASLCETASLHELVL